MPRDKANDQAFHSALGRALRDAREATGRTQESVGLAVGLGRSYISDLELGKRRPYAVSVDAIARELGVPCGELWAEADRLRRMGSDLKPVKCSLS